MVGDGSAAGASPSGATTVRGRGSPMYVRMLAAVGLVLMVVVMLRIVGMVATNVTSGSASRVPPGTTQGSQAAEGSKLFSSTCASCHGAGGNRVTAAPLNSRQFVDALGPKLEQTIMEGKGTMPAFGLPRGGPLSREQSKNVAAYLTSSQGPAGAIGTVAKATAAPTALPSATPEQRRAPTAIPHRFAGQENRCLDCHNKGGVAPVPVSHAGRANSACALCHLQAATASAAPTSTPATR